MTQAQAVAVALIKERHGWTKVDARKSVVFVHTPDEDCAEIDQHGMIVWRSLG